MQIPYSNSSAPRRVAVLGSTGSIGVNCLDVIRSLKERLVAIGLSANSSWESLLKQVEEHRPRTVAVTDAEAARALQSRLPSGIELLVGQNGIADMVSRPDVDVVVVAIVGAAGLFGTLAALKAGKTVAVANKETLVIAGSLVRELAARSGASIIPVDSEHSAIFQCLQGSHWVAGAEYSKPRQGEGDRGRAGASEYLSPGHPKSVARVVLTSSGGPFRGRTAKDLENVTIDEALRHPTWRMGPKITIDSATLMNKALEIIEARWLFDLRPEQIQVIVHPESIVHSFVEFVDGSVLAQLSPPDMRLPIQYALLYPERVPGPARRLDWDTLRQLTFEKPDAETFPALQLGYEVARRGGTCGAVLNAANEAAVQRFLNGTLRFVDIARVCRLVLDAHDFRDQPSLEELLAADAWARQEVEHWGSG